MKEIAVVLDIDGLMVDTEPISRLAWDRVLGHYGRILDDDLHTRIIGYRIDESVIMIIDEYDIPANPAEIKELKKIEYDQIMAQGAPVMPGLYDLVEAINRNGLPWAVATSSPFTHAQEILQQLGLSDSCAAIAGGDEVPRGKPAPDIYLLAAKRLGIPPQNCLALEDSPPGCRAALAAGMMTLAVPNGDTQNAVFPPVHQVFPSLSAVSLELDRLLFDLKSR